MSRWGRRVCAACGHDLDRDEFSKNQWSLGVGISRCTLCVSEGLRTNDSRFCTARENQASKGVVNRHEIVGEGAFRDVYGGEYTAGHRRGQKLVAKFFKKGAVYEEVFFEEDIRAVDKALDLLTSWNQAGIISQQIRLNKPQVWRMLDDGQRHLVEPYIDNYTKFNSNTGWTSRDGGDWNKVMQALSHYTYHVSSGQFLLCDLQGGLYRDGPILSDPVVHSRQGKFGVTDLGPRGISSFFSGHVCNKFCKSNWTKPRDRTAYFAAQEGTSMELPAQRHHANAFTPMSHIQEWDSSSDDDWYQ
jgi:hypothetical protein